MNSTPHILIVDDHQEIRDLLSRFFLRHGLQATACADGMEMRRTIGCTRVDLIILDLMLPGDDGLTLCRELRAPGSVHRDLPIIMLTAMSDDADRISGLEIGADDYVLKPFNPRELLARIKAVLRRTSSPGVDVVSAPKAIHFAGWTLNLTRRELLSPEGAIVALTGAEYDLLLTFAERPNQVLGRDKLLELARNRLHAYDRSVDVQVSRLRRKLGDDVSAHPLIKTVRGAGYVLTVEVQRS
ncbi:response regulator [Azospirillum sp. B21]|uniref:response regulator n=1 Tax=unclassified Azospirillum TaxID=2630922 RepID=UPI0011EC6F6A|nr:MULTISPECIES: response regulator [unclassified Azospirillum]KAA0576134.1 response regulator [Azospirillum sp. B21]MDR6774772.1 two-component system OmpR family response regulator [Azospirillum sp. BE72]